MTRRITIGIRKLEALRQRCFERNIKLNKEKMKLKVDSVIYRKFVFSKNGMCIGHQKVRAIQAMQLPMTDRECRVF